MYWLYGWIIVTVFVAPCHGEVVSEELARVVAENTVRYHVSHYGKWGNSAAAEIIEGNEIIFGGKRIAFNFEVSPAGHVLIAGHFGSSPVLLYSETSDFQEDRIEIIGSLESWIAREIFENIADAGNDDGEIQLDLQTAASTDSRKRIAGAWRLYSETDPVDFSSGADDFTGSQSVSGENMESVGPVLMTSWGQFDPYNSFTPADGGCAHTLTGCVATAFAQLAAYWNWPPKGTGSHSYSWQASNGSTITLSANFSHAYQWDLMPRALDSRSGTSEIEAVAQLISDMGIATNMAYGCKASSSAAFADDILDVYFRYTPSMEEHHRSNYTSDQWFSLFTSELDADPPRPVILSIFLADYSGGHETVVDGYQKGPTDKIHINFGQSGSYDGYYDTTNAFSTGSYLWDRTSQVAITGIEPLNTAPTANAGGDQVALSGSIGTLAGAGIDPDGASIAAYQWKQLEGPVVTIGNPHNPVTEITIPDLAEGTSMIFQLRVTDSLGATDTDDVVVAVTHDPNAVVKGDLPKEIDGDGTGKDSGLSGDENAVGRRGCFIYVLMHQP